MNQLKVWIEQRFRNPKRQQSSIQLLYNQKKKRERVNIKTNSKQEILQSDHSRYEIDKQYFDSYSDPQIHQEMVKDEIRVNCYYQQIDFLCKDMLCIDVGAGSGILSMLASKAGAKHVYAIEYFDYSNECTINILENNLKSQITLINELAEETILPVEKVDIIISEWMGYFLLCENMLPSVISIRDIYLKKGGTMIPRKVEMFLAAFSKPTESHGLQLASVDKALSNQASIDECKPEWLASNSFRILELDLLNDQLQNNQFRTDFVLTISKACKVSGLVGWFDTELSEGVLLSTSPLQPLTHWKHTLLYFRNLVEVKDNARLTGSILVGPQPQNHRALRIELTIKSQDKKRRPTTPMT